MVSAPDIITYIGIPLAVLGVLPIIYNTLTTIATLQKIRRILRHGRLTAITRGDVINHVIEVELPRYTISPLDRETCKDYWRLSAFPSAILGGSWTIFNWRMNTTGIKTQRIDYSDQLRQPQAEIEFEELVSYMLDLGAVPDAPGFRMLRTSGLWVPTGTPLLLSPNQQDAALMVAPLDDSDGKLSLAVSWSSDWCMRDQHSLPPYWAVIKGIPPPRPTAKGDIEPEKNLKGTQTDDKVPPSEEEKEDAQKAIEPLSEVKTQPNLMAGEIISNSPPAIRCKVGLEGLTAAIADDDDAQMFDQPDITHLDTESGNNSKGIWFASTLTALGSTSQAILWNYKIPTSILSFSRKDTIPCGILVMLGIVEESYTPEIFTQYNDSAELNEAQFRKMRERS